MKIRGGEKKEEQGTTKPPIRSPWGASEQRIVNRLSTQRAASSLKLVLHDDDNAKGQQCVALEEQQDSYSYSRQAVVTLSSAGRAWISLKHGLDAPNPDDLVTLSPVLF